MEVLQIETWATPGKPAAIGHLGTVVLGPANSAGEILVKFTLSKKGLRRLGQCQTPKLDTSEKKSHNAGDGKI